jgi:hypothetical protein
VLHDRRGGSWNLTTGSYPELRIPHRWLTDQCHAAGLRVHHDDIGPGGLRVLHAVRS